MKRVFCPLCGEKYFPANSCPYCFGDPRIARDVRRIFARRADEHEAERWGIIAADDEIAHRLDY